MSRPDSLPQDEASRPGGASDEPRRGGSSGAPVRSFRDARWLNWILRLLVGGAFVFAGVMKIADPAKFVLDVENYRLVPHVLVNLVAILVPWTEVVTGFFVLVGIWQRAAALIITGLTTMFAVVIGSALTRGLNIECGCFGTVGGKHIGLVNLAIDATLSGLATLLVWSTGAPRDPAGIPESGPAQLS